MSEPRCQQVRHSWEVVEEFGTGPVAVTCSRCGWSGAVKMDAPPAG